MSYSYVYPITNTMNSKVESDVLKESIESDNNITIKLSSVSYDSSDITIVFLNELSTSEQSVLASIVSAHTGEKKVYYDLLKLDGPETEDSRLIFANNRIPSGYSLYVTGAGDDIDNGVYGEGVKLKFSPSNTTREFQMLKHWYIVGARATWVDCDEDNYFDCVLYAPASQFTVETGDFIKVLVANGKSIFVPTTPGTGTHNLDLDGKLTNTDILKCVPVPMPGNTGFFDYDADNNVLTVNYSQKGGYNLWDSDISLHQFGKYVWGRSGNFQTALDVSGLVGKKLFNCWKAKFEFKLDGGMLQVSNKARITLIVGAQGNVEI